MDGYLPLKPLGNTQALAAIPGTPGSASTGPSTLLSNNSGETTFVFDNSTNGSAAWVGYGMTSSAAKANAVIPLLGGSSPALRVAKNTVQPFVLNGGTFANVVMEAGSATVNVLVGYGT